MSKLPTGKGAYIWCVLDTEGGDPGKIAAEAKRMGFGHVLWHVVDGWANDAKCDPWSQNLIHL